MTEEEWGSPAKYEFPPTPDIEKAYRSASSALAALLPSTSLDIASSGGVLELLSQWPHLVREAELAVISQIGPSLSWVGPDCDQAWNLVPASVDLDRGNQKFGEIDLTTDAVEAEDGSWADSALGRAGLVYKRECGWDFAPDEAGFWLLMLAPVSACPAEEESFSVFNGHLAGFVVVHDRDDDGAYETVAHIWTAVAWRRRGIARRLLAEARSRFSVTAFEEPYTNDGSALIDASRDS